jgi:NAD(P)-dependent dehydrogenase (short-subunit alcohol dehydrogenase family)
LNSYPDFGLAGQVALVTGAARGLGNAIARALAHAGADVALGLRDVNAPGDGVAQIEAMGRRALPLQMDMTRLNEIFQAVDHTVRQFGRLDILVNNAGANVLERSWAKLTPDRIKTVLDANLNSAFYCSVAALAIMRPQKDGLLIHTASWAGRFVGIVPGPAYVAAKHAVVAMSYSINMEEFQHGIRSTVLCPNEVATPILDLRPTPVSAEDRARMIQPEHMADLILYIAKQPASICLNEIVISPTWNRGYAHLAGLGPKR